MFKNKLFKLYVIVQALLLPMQELYENGQVLYFGHSNSCTPYMRGSGGKGGQVVHPPEKSPKT